MPMKNREFLQLVRDVALEALSDELPDCRLRSSLLQLYFGDPRQHYEVWVRSQAGLMELGLHFEGEKEDNLRRIAVVAEAMPMVVGQLGTAVEVEEWTERWTRVHETIPLGELTEDFAVEVGRRLARYIEVLEPIVSPLGPMRPPAPHEQADSRRWRGRRRGG